MTVNDRDRSGTHALRLLRALANEGRPVFSASEARAIATRVGIPEQYVKSLLGQMVRNGWLVRLRRGLYTMSGVASGDIDVHPFVIATTLVTPSAISHWSALSHHGLTDQVPRVVTAFTPKKVVTPSMRRGDHDGSARHAWEIAGVPYQYVSVKSEHFFGIEQVWVDENSRVPIADRERTVLETFVSPRPFGGIALALRLIESYTEELQLDRLVDYAVRFGRISVAKRLGWALDRAHVEESILVPLLNVQATGYHALDPARPKRGPCDRRWMIQDNLQAQPQ